MHLHIHLRHALQELVERAVDLAMARRAACAGAPPPEHMTCDEVLGAFAHLAEALRVVNVLQVRAHVSVNSRICISARAG